MSFRETLRRHRTTSDHFKSQQYTVPVSTLSTGTEGQVTNIHCNVPPDGSLCQAGATQTLQWATGKTENTAKYSQPSTLSPFSKMQKGRKC